MKKRIKAIVENAAPSMKAQLLKLGGSNFNGKVANSAWNRIPTVSKVDIGRPEWNEILKELGLNLRCPRQIDFNLKTSRSMNRYMEHQIIRLRKARGTDLYWVIANYCLRKSVSFRVSAVNHVIPSWWYAWSVDSMKMLNDQVSKIFRHLKEELNYRRVYIEKANGKYRPLGVPSPSWRIALHMLNNMISIATEEKLLNCQHGYRPGKGTLSAWRDVLTKVIDKKYIYETDLKNFFGEVYLDDVDMCFKDLKMPIVMRKWFYNLNRTYPKLPQNLRLAEPIIESVQIEDKKQEDKLFPGKINAESITDYLTAPPEIKGLAQGAPTSPLCSILVLKKYLSQTKVCVNYADDQIFAANRKFTVRDDPDKGLIHAKDKCKWIKYEGKWLSELKFLGMVYNPWNNTLRSETRAGISETIHDNIIHLWTEMAYNKHDNYLVDLAQRNILGYIQACLYSGSWNRGEFQSEVEEQLGMEKRLSLSTTKSWYGGYKKSSTVSSDACSFLAKIFRNKLRKY